MTGEHSTGGTYLHRYDSGRYQVVNGPVQVVFSSVERTSIRGDFKLLDEKGEIVGRVNRVSVDNDVMGALDGVSEGDGLELDEFVPERYKEAGTDQSATGRDSDGDAQ